MNSHGYPKLFTESLDVPEKHASPLTRLPMVDDPREADYVVLPKHWTCYLWDGKKDMDSALRMEEYGKPILIWFKGDLVPKIPFTNYKLFLPGSVGSQPNHFGCPAFIDDPGPAPIREKQDVPTVGFCGYAESDILKTAWSIVNSLRVRDFHDAPILPSTFLRSKALKALEKSPLVNTNFIVRKKFTASPGCDEFYQNIRETDYTLCVRGNGNWSYRFYQTLASGRIPVFIDTDCVLPDVVDWKNYCVWVRDIRHIGEIVAEFHDNLSNEDFRELQVRCRSLWEKNLTMEGFIDDVPRLLRGDFSNS